MIEQNSNNQNDDRMDHLIDSLLSGNMPDTEISEVLDHENEELLAAARQVISLSQNYPGPPELSTQDRLRILTKYKAQYQQKLQPGRRKLSSFFKQNQISLAVPAGLILVILFFVFRRTGGALTKLPASAGVQSSPLPFIILVVVAIVTVILLLRKN